MKQPYYQLNHHRLSQDAIFQTNGIHLDGWYALRKPLTARGNSIPVSELTENSQSNTPSRNITLRINLSMNEPEHISSFVPGALNELLGMIERGEREREKDCEKKGVDLQTEFHFDLYTRKQVGENEARNLENYERTKTKS